jgi:hypothetical protein
VALRPLGSDPNGQIYAIHRWEQHINHYQVGMPVFQEDKCLFGGVNTFGFVAALGEDRHERIGNHSLIVDNQNSSSLLDLYSQVRTPGGSCRTTRPSRS